MWLSFKNYGQHIWALLTPWNTPFPLIVFRVSARFFDDATKLMGCRVELGGRFDSVGSVSLISFSVVRLIHQPAPSRTRRFQRPRSIQSTRSTSITIRHITSPCRTVAPDAVTNTLLLLTPASTVIHVGYVPGSSHLSPVRVLNYGQLLVHSRALLSSQIACHLFLSNCSWQIDWLINWTTNRNFAFFFRSPIWTYIIN